MRYVFPALAGLLAVLGLSAAEPFPEPVNNQRGDHVLTPAEVALKKFTLPEGFQVTLFAGEPDVRQPIALTTDSRGRLWVAECYSYDDRSNNYSADQRDRVVIYEDTDNDGRFDRRKVFWDEAWKLTSVEVGFGGVWVLCAPRLLFIPDRDGDDVPDGEPEVILEGWDDDRIRHNIVNGLRWGPDGWLYGRHGITTSSHVGRPGAASGERTMLNCSIWRLHPVTRKFEVVCHGGTNPWGHDWDEHGELFWINTVIGHFWHGIPGGYFKRMFGEHLRPNLYEYIDQHADHYHWDTRRQWHEERSANGVTDTAGGGHAHCGMMVYQGDNWPKAYRGELFAINLLGRRVNRDHIEPRGNGFVAKHRPDLLHANDEWFRGVDLITGPDGGVFIADWSDVGECHENDGIHRTSGRIWKVTHGRVHAPKFDDVSKLTDEALVALQEHENDWYARQARRALQERAVRGEDMAAARAGLLQRFLNHPRLTVKLRAMWGLHVSGGLDAAWLREQLTHPEERVRVWAVRLLTQEQEVDGLTQAALVDIARLEKSGLVRLYLASALQRMPVASRLPLAEVLVRRGEDARDHNQPLMLWYGVEPLVEARPMEAVHLASISRIDLVSRLLVRRITERIEEDPATLDHVLSSMVFASEGTPDESFLQGMAEALRGWRKAPKPRRWDEVASRFGGDDKAGVGRWVRELSVVFGDGRALGELRALVTDNDADGENRRAALKVLIKNRPEDLAALLKVAIRSRETEGLAVRGMATVDDAGVPKEILNRYARLKPADQVAAISTLASRAGYAGKLLDAVEQGLVPRRDIKAFHARQIGSLGDGALSARLKLHWGDIRQADAEKLRQMDQLRASLTPAVLASADRSAGRHLFNLACATCHTLFGEGGQIGPDLTGGNRGNLDYLLENIVAPSAMVAGDYLMSTLTLRDGRVLNGVVMRETGRSLEVQTPVEKVTVEQGEIRSRVGSKLSLMPEGLLEAMSPTQVRNLIGYLMGPGQVPLP